MTTTPIPVESGRVRVRDVEIFRHAAPSPAGVAPVLYVHGVPTNADDWLPFLELTGGYAPDLPGFGRSDKPRHFDYSPRGFGTFLTSFVEQAAIGGRFSLLVHDWGAVGLAIAPELLARVERLVVVAAVPFDPEYRWHRIARVWRTPIVGELAMGFTTRRVFERLSRARATNINEELLERVWSGFDHGTQRAILKLYRSASPRALGAPRESLRMVTAPARIIWGDRDPYLPPRFAERYAEAFGGEAVVEVVEAGHWPWIDRPELVEDIAGFLLGR